MADWSPSSDPHQLEDLNQDCLGFGKSERVSTVPTEQWTRPNRSGPRPGPRPDSKPCPGRVRASGASCTTQRLRVRAFSSSGNRRPSKRSGQGLDSGHSLEKRLPAAAGAGPTAKRRSACSRAPGPPAGLARRRGSWDTARPAAPWCSPPPGFARPFVLGSCVD